MKSKKSTTPRAGIEKQGWHLIRKGNKQFPQHFMISHKVAFKKSDF